ncbi:MAG: immunoglobulin-like domain-containing protein [Syntrophomonas sp.]
MRKKWGIWLAVGLILSWLLAGAGVNQGEAANAGALRPTIAAGRYHCLAVKSDGTVWAWGYNGDHQLGNPDSIIEYRPHQVEGLAGFVNVAAAGDSSIALKSNGIVYAWGNNDHGQLGDGTTAVSNTPVQVKGLLKVVAIASGGSDENAHCLALKNDGTVWAWGGNKHGELGDGTTIDRSTPVQVTGLSGVTAIAAGDGYSMALKDGTVWGWGCPNTYDETAGSSLSPVQVRGLWNVTVIAEGMALESEGSVWTLGKDWVPREMDGLSKVTVGLAGSRGNHDMGWYEDGTVWNKGINYNGALGVDDEDYSAGKYMDPVQVKNLSGVSCAAVEDYFGLALKTDGTLWAWGENTMGQLGSGTLGTGTECALSPVQVKAPGWFSSGYFTDVMQPTWSIAGVSASDAADSDAVQAALEDLDFDSIKGANSEASNITSDLSLPSAGAQGTTLSWSSSPAGIIASNGKLTKPSTDTVVTLTTTISKGAISVGKDFVLTVKAGTGGSGEENQIQITPLAAGYFQSMAVKNDGSVWAWGLNDTGQLGDGTTTNQFIPVQVHNLQDIKAVSAGDYHSAALTGTGTVWVWGDNGSGQLGDGSETDHNTPVQVPGLTGVTAIAAGGRHNLGLTGSGRIKAWGHSYYGQVGNGETITNCGTPVELSSLAGIVAVAAGANHSLAIMGSDGSVWAWGCNDRGQLGDGTNTSHSTPTKVPGLSGITAISATFRGDHSLAVAGDGSVWAWGANDYGQLGDGTKTDRNTPVKVLGLDGVKIVAVIAGHRHSLALASDGTVWGWGNNFDGQVGDGVATAAETNVNTSASKVVGLTGATAIAVGGFHSLALKNDGTVWAWGANRIGQLGTGDSDFHSTPAQVQGAGEVGKLTDIMQPNGQTSTPVSEVNLNQSEINLNCGQTAVLTVALNPADANNQQVTWDSSSPAVASVTGSGLTVTVTALSPGETTITVTTADGGETATCRVTVSEIDEGNYIDWEGTTSTVYPTDKYWTIKFNTDVSSSSIIDSNFFIGRDINGKNKVPGTHLESPDTKTVVINPPEGGWSANSTYYLFINSEVKSTAGKTINRGTRMRFDT